MGQRTCSKARALWCRPWHAEAGKLQMPKWPTWTFSRQSPTPPHHRRLWHCSKLYSSSWGGCCAGKDVRYAALDKKKKKANPRCTIIRVTAYRTLISTHGLLFGFFIHFLYQPLISSLQLSMPIAQAVLMAFTWEYLENGISLRKSGSFASWYNITKQEQIQVLSRVAPTVFENGWCLIIITGQCALSVSWSS